MAKKQTAVKKKEEVKDKVREESQVDSDGLIDTVYLIKKTGIEMIEGIDAMADIKAIREASKGDDTPYTFYESGRPVYWAIKNGSYSPLVFPEPGSKVKEGQMGYTSIQLYGWAVTLASTIERIIEILTEPKPSLIDQARKIMTPTIVIVAAIIGVFLIVAMIGG